MTDEPRAEVVDLHRRTPADDALTTRLRALAGSGFDGSDRSGDGGSASDADALLAKLGSALPQPPLALRLVIGVLAALQLLAVGPWLVDADPFGLLKQSSPAHLARDGALGLAVAAAGGLTAWRPRWALPCFVIGSITLVAQTVAGVFDTHARSGNELVHLPSVVLTCLVGLSAIRLGALGPRRPSH